MTLTQRIEKARREKAAQDAKDRLCRVSTQRAIERLRENIAH